MNAGKLKTPIKVIKQATEITESGATKVIDEVILNSRCYIKDKSGDFIESANELIYYNQTKLLMRFNKNITTDCLVEFNDELYNIVLIKELNRDIELTVKIVDK